MSKLQPAGIRIAPLHALEELQSCVDLQIAVWGYSETDVIPRKMFLLAGRIGGQVIGAIDDSQGGKIVGFAMAIPGYRDRHPYLHSHMLAVLPAYRNHGLGRLLKLAQRDDALTRGIELMEWTFDPLEIKNAHLNITRLGGVCRRYQPNLYGPSSSPLQGGLPTDRLYAEWWLSSPRVQRYIAAEGTQPETSQVVEEVLVPHAIHEWKENPILRERALQIQGANREALQSAFSRGLAVIDYRRDSNGDGRFLLGRLDPSEIEPSEAQVPINMCK